MDKQEEQDIVETAQEIFGEDPRQPDDDFIKDELRKKEAKETAEYDLELFLSTDGKNTVHVKVSKPEARREAIIKATELYETILKRYGTKVGQAIKENGKVAPVCGIHGSVMVWKEGVSKTTGKKYAFWSCPTRNADDSFCTFKPKA